MTDLAYKNGGTNLFTPFSWSFDNVSRVTQFVSADGTSDYSYDKTGQLTVADHNYQSDEAYSYDANGNRTMSGYTTGSNNQLTNDGTYSYTYDDEGNRLTRTNDSTSESTEYSWDFRNRLTKVTEKDSYGSATQVVEYTYDVFDRRIGKAVDTTSPFTMADAVIERYVYDDANGVSSIDGSNVVLDFVDPDGSGSTPIAISKRYLYGNAVDQLFAQEDVTVSTSSADRVLWPLADNLGTVRDLAKNDGTLGEHYTYDSYGNIQSGDTSLTRYLYTSREYDPDTGLQYNRARWYDPAVGKWISEDPLGFGAGDANLSRYVGGGVTNATDPSGFRKQPMAPGVAAPLSLATDPDVFALMQSMLFFGQVGWQDLYWDYFWPWSNPSAVNGWDTALSVGKYAAWTVSFVSGGWAAGLTVAGAGGATGGAALTESTILLGEGESLIGWTQYGQVVKLVLPNTSHAAIGADLGLVVEGAAIEGAEAVTVLKSAGEITVWGSHNFGGLLSVSAKAVQAVKAMVK